MIAMTTNIQLYVVVVVIVIILVFLEFVALKLAALMTCELLYILGFSKCKQSNALMTTTPLRPTRIDEWQQQQCRYVLNSKCVQLARGNCNTDSLTSSYRSCRCCRCCRRRKQTQFIGNFALLNLKTLEKFGLR